MRSRRLWYGSSVSYSRQQRARSAAVAAWSRARMQACESHSEHVERVQVVRVLVSERLDDLDRAPVAALGDEDFAQIGSRLPVVRVVQEHQAQAAAAVEIGDRVREAVEEAERVP